jgi:arylformamidase
MKVIDLSLPLFDKMPVYPGDPEVDISVVHTLDKQGWLLRTLSLTTHLGTHVNVPAHMVEGGKTLSNYLPETFFGMAKVYVPGEAWDDQIGVIFRDENITPGITEQLIKTPPKFIGLSAEHEFSLELEKKLLEAEIISFENLANCEQLPDGEFEFYGLPLKIDLGDGSPVRAIAVVN